MWSPDTGGEPVIKTPPTVLSGRPSNHPSDAGADPDLLRVNSVRLLEKLQTQSGAPHSRSVKWRRIALAALAYGTLVGVAALLVSSPLALRIYAVLGIVWTALVVGTLVVVGVGGVTIYLWQLHRRIGAKGLRDEAWFAGRAFAPFLTVLVASWVFGRIGVHPPPLIGVLLLFACIIYVIAKYQYRGHDGPTLRQLLEILRSLPDRDKRAYQDHVESSQQSDSEKQGNETAPPAPPPDAQAPSPKDTADRDGSSPDKAIVVASVLEEHQWVAHNCPAFTLALQSLVVMGDKSFDVLTLRSQSGTVRDVYFDVSALR